MSVSVSRATTLALRSSKYEGPFLRVYAVLQTHEMAWFGPEPSTFVFVDMLKSAAKTIHGFAGKTLSGETVEFSKLAGKVCLVVNVASH